MNNQSPVAIVTGASSGFGKLTAEALARRGYTVYGTSRSERPDAETDLHMRVLDVADDDSVNRFVEGVRSEAGRIDVLVNNAGRTVSGLAEETPLASAESLFQTNFFGAARMVNAVLPAMREQRAGTIIFISSLAGLVGTPGQAYYAATKHAIEGYGETLAAEVAPFNISVSLVEPGFFRTEIHTKAEFLTEQAFSDYDDAREALNRAFDESVHGGDDPQKVADLVARIAADDDPKLRYRVGRDAVWVPRLKTLLPTGLFQAGMRRQFGL